MTKIQHNRGRGRTPNPARGLVAEFLAARRAAAGLTQAELAEQVGVKIATVQAIESGRNVPSATTLREIRQALGIRVTELADHGAVATLVVEDWIERATRDQVLALLQFVEGMGRRGPGGRGRVGEGKGDPTPSAS